MTNREKLIQEISVLPDFIIKQLLDIVRYVRLGIEDEYMPETDNEFYNSDEFGKIVSESVADYRSGDTEDMDTLQQ